MPAPAGINAALVAAATAALLLYAVNQCCPASPKVKWSVRVDDTVEGNINVADLRGTGEWDVLFNTRDHGVIFCLDAKGRERWRYEPPGEVRLCGSISVFEDATARAKRVLSVSRDGWLYCLDADGKLLWKHKSWAGSLYGGPVVASDATGNTVIVMACEDGRVHSLTPQGDIAWEFAAPNAIYDPAAIGDVDGDGRAEILFGCKDNFFYCLADDGSMKWRIKTGAENASGPILIDLDRDGAREVLFGSWDRNLYCADGKTGTVLWKAPSDGQVTNSTAAADLDGDGRLEIMYGGHKKFFCVDAAGKPKWTFFPRNAQEMIVSYPPVVGDVTGDGRPEVIFGSKNGSLYCLSAEGKLVWSRPMSLVNIVSGPALHDIDSDGLLDIVYATSGGDVICLATKGSAKARPPWPLGRWQPTLNANLGPIGSVARGVEPQPPIETDKAAVEMHFDGVLNIQKSQPKKDGATIDWMVGENYASFADIGVVELYVESRDPLHPVRGNLSIKVVASEKTSFEHQRRLAPPSGSAVIKVNLAHILAHAPQQRVETRLVDDAGTERACAILEVQTVLRAPLREQANALLRRLESEQAKGPDPASALSIRLMRRLVEYARDDLEAMELGRAREILHQIEARLNRPGPLGQAPPKPPAQNVALKDGVVVVNGRPFFPIGIYNVQTPEDVRTLVKLGFNTAFNAGNEEFMKACDETGMMVIGSGPGEHMQDYERLEQVRAHMEGLYSHPSLLGWYVVDEPSLRRVPPEVIRRTTALLEMIDPYHITLLVDGSRFRSRPYQALVQVAAPAYYPIWKGMPVTHVAECVDQTVEVVPAEQPVWFVLEAFAWSTQLRFPTPAEERCMAYLAVIHGARGLAWFAYKGWGFDPIHPEKSDTWTALEMSPPLWQEILEEVRQFNELAPWLVGRRVPPRVEREGLKRLDWCVIERGQEVLVLACNPAPVGFRHTFRIEGLEGPVQALWENRTVQARDGAFTDRFEPMQVHVYRGRKVSRAQREPSARSSMRSATASAGTW